MPKTRKRNERHWIINSKETADLKQMIDIMTDEDKPMTPYEFYMKYWTIDGQPVSKEYAEMHHFKELFDMYDHALKNDLEPRIFKLRNGKSAFGFAKRNQHP